MFWDQDAFNKTGKEINSCLKKAALLLALGVVVALLIGWGLWWLWTHFT